MSCVCMCVCVLGREENNFEKGEIIKKKELIKRKRMTIKENTGYWSPLVIDLFYYYC